ncbi:cyclic nucleotide-binding domain-containing protein [bacterium]|jgi:CRP-like cAMP-binding protein|nr:cyclic nucleotide-binding domain-containing protein [bacterium]
MDSFLELLTKDFDSNPLFAFFSKEEFDEFLDIATIEKFGSGEVLFKKDDEPQGLYFFFQGKVQITRAKPNRPPRVIAEIEAPTILGEMAMLVHRLRTSTATTLSESTVLLFARDDYNRLLGENNLMAFKLSHNMGIILAKRIEMMNKSMMDTKQEFKEFSSFKNSLFNDWNF